MVGRLAGFSECDVIGDSGSSACCYARILPSRKPLWLLGRFAAAAAGCEVADRRGLRMRRDIGKI